MWWNLFVQAKMELKERDKHSSTCVKSSLMGQIQPGTSIYVACESLPKKIMSAIQVYCDQKLHPRIHFVRDVSLLLIKSRYHSSISRCGTWVKYPKKRQFHDRWEYECMLLDLMEKSQYPPFNKAASVPTECPFLLFFDTKTQANLVTKKSTKIWEGTCYQEIWYSSESQFYSDWRDRLFFRSFLSEAAYAEYVNYTYNICHICARHVFQGQISIIKIRLNKIIIGY